jgi:nicotinamidase-related amidase
VISGLWTDECIISTAYAASSRGYDVVVVGDAVVTMDEGGAECHHARPSSDNIV